jgi:hypothetical protein
MSQTNSIMPGETQPPLPPKGWLARNWKLLVGLVVATVALVVAAVFGLFFFVVSILKGSEVTKGALARARSNTAVVQHLAAPIVAGWWASGSINLTGNDGDAKLTLPISGPKGKGKLYIIAEKHAGTWTYTLLQLEIDGSGEKIDLLASPPVVSATLLSGVIGTQPLASRLPSVASRGFPCLPVPV